MSQTRRLEVSIDDQTLKVFEGNHCIREYPVSTAVKGMGFELGSYRTPTGRFRIAEMIGGGEPQGTIFKNRLPVGFWQEGSSNDGDLILSRILRLDGLESENANTFDRLIYIHGTNHTDKLGQPSSHGCIRLGNAEIVELFEMVSEGDELVVIPAEKRRGKLLFIDCDSTLSTIEGIDELARAKGDAIFSEVVNLTHAAMNGDVPIDEIFSRRMEMIRPDRAVCDRIANLYIETVVPGAADMIHEMKAAGWLPVILSGGFAPLIEPLARLLEIDHVEAVPLYLSADGSYQGYGNDYPTTRNLGKNEVIRLWKKALLPERIAMIGDGVSDLETKVDVDVFIGFGGVVARSKVKSGCDHWFTDMCERSMLRDVIEGK